MTTNPTQIRHLFVYGTLMRASEHPMARYLRKHSVYIGEGHFPGRLYDLGSYPGALFEPDSNTIVYGEVSELTTVEAVMAALDRYEGVDENPAEYSRQLVPVRVEGEIITCWTYVYLQPVQGLRQLISGRYYQT